MAETKTLRGFCTITYYAADVPAAAKWYRELLGIDPYFVRPAEGRPEYVEFRFGDYQHELGIVDAKYKPKAATTSGPGGAIASWHVDDIAGMIERLKRMGAQEYEPIIEREAGFKTASVVDPFGNVVGLMYNPHYLEMLSARPRS
jgi:predicted enzyme related to lactoylglutathione lyase